jgi:ketosteroid isomerase-like protein
LYFTGNLKIEMMKTISLFIVALTLFSCTGIEKGADSDVLKEADIAFSNRSNEVGMQQAFLDYIDSEGVLLRVDNYPILGREHLASEFSKSSDTAYVLQWKPSFAEIASSGDLGYTYGFYEVRLRSDTSMLLDEGTYVSIWKKQDDGSWKFVLDTGNKGLGK